MTKKNRNDFLNKTAIESFDIEGHKCWIVRGPIEGLNGYVHFEKRPVRETGYGGIINYVPVHGGITYAEEDDAGIVYGFDTAHCNSGVFPRYEHAWIKSQINIMLQGIKKAAEVEEAYLLAFSNEEKAKHADSVRAISPDSELGFGAMINLMSGQI